MTRSVRRLPSPFDLERLGEVTTSPWDHGYAALGHRMLYNKHVSPPMAFGMPMIDIDAEHVKTYAQTHVGSDSEREDLPEAGIGDDSQVAKPSAADVAAQAPAEVQKRGDGGDLAQPSSPKKQRVGEEQPLTPLDEIMDESGERAPKTPKLADSPKQQFMQQVKSTNLELYEHEDAAVTFDFHDDDLDRLEKYEMEFYDDEFLQADDNSLTTDSNMSEIIKQLTFPYTAKEPELSADELMKLDALADQLELQRLEKLQVLQDPSVVPSNSKVLSTRFVRTWREKHNDKGEAIWLRRSRFVAREFAWLEPERESLFSPASGSIISRILPTIFLEQRERRNMVLASLDVRDAFLTVTQERPTLVHTTDAQGVARSYALGRVLPGQRDGSLLWYQAITSFLKAKLDLVEHEPYPCILKSKDGSCVVMIHVDDLLIVGGRDYVHGTFLPALKREYDISVQCIEKPGDELTFLKRVYTLNDDGRLILEIHTKHVNQLCSLLGMNPRNQNKKTPAHADMEKEDHTADLSATTATTFRTCVGILMYLANDVPHAQHVIRHLATYSSRPTEKSLVVLRHLVSYLASHRDVGLSLKWAGDGCGIYHDYPDLDSNENVLECFTDSDWASDRNSRRSVSCCVMFMVAACSSALQGLRR